ncbi:translation initiation factor IF-2 N-terminal domain-containing protein, partial [Mycobacterium avium]
MVDGAPTADPSEESTRSGDLPDRLRVHSLARTLGTTSKRVLDALSELDGRVRSAHSTVDREDAVRVRDLLAAQPSAEPEPAAEDAASGGPDAGITGEPESRLLLETPDATERPHYMPLFVAPQPLESSDDDGDADETADSDDSDGDDDEQADRPSSRRRRR